MTTLGAFVLGTARLSRRSGIRTAPQGDVIAISDIYALLLAPGTVPNHTASGLPAKNSTHGTYTKLYLQTMTFDCVSDACGAWEVTAVYGVDEPEEEEEEEEDVVKITARAWGTTETSADLMADATTGVPVLNSAGDPFDSVPQRPLYAPMVSFTRLESKHPAAVCAISGSCNESEATCLGVTFAARTAMIKVSARDTMIDTKLRYEVTYTIEGRTLYAVIGAAIVNIGWDEAFIESGYYYKSGATRLRFVEADDTGVKRPSAAPCLLKADGTDNRGAAPIVKRVAALKASTWTALRLPA